MKDKTVCFTGHRDIPLLKRNAVARRLRKTLAELIEQGYCNFCAGGALGFDTVAALTVLELKEKYPQIKLILILPCQNQTHRWSEKDIQVYEDILSRADKVEYTAEHYFRGCMHKRNRQLVDNSSVCVCYSTEDKGGTAYTVKYAQSNELTVINVAK